MTRKNLINRVAEKFGLKKKEAEAIVKFIFQEIAETVKKGGGYPFRDLELLN